MSICSEAIIFGVRNTENNTYFHIIVEIMKKIRALSSPWKKIEWWKLQASLTNGNSGQPWDVWGSSRRKFWKLSALRAFLEHLKQFLKHNNSSKICYFYYDKIFLAHFWYQGAAAPRYRAPVFLSTQVWQPLATRNFIALRGVWGPCTRKFWSLAFLILQIQN